jgi:hypothetical protein
LYVPEFSKINLNAGRDHHRRANCALLAGAGIPAGLVLGKTGARGDSPTDRPATAADLAALIYLKLGIAPEYKFEAPDGRPIGIVANAQPTRELL